MWILVFISKWYSDTEFFLKVELAAGVGLWAVPVVWDHCTCNQKRSNLSHRGNPVANFLLLAPSAGWLVKHVYNSCKIHSWNLSLAVPPPTQAGQAKVFISCSIHSPACSPRKGSSSITLPLSATAGITVLWLHPKTRAVPESLEFVVLWEVMDERVSVGLTWREARELSEEL